MMDKCQAQSTNLKSKRPDLPGNSKIRSFRIPKIRRSDLLKRSGLLSLILSFAICLLSLKPKAALAAEALYFIHSDHLSSTTLVTNNQGEIISRRAYYPYGETRSSEGASPTERAYTS